MKSRARIHPRRTLPRRNRRGAAYLITLGITLIVSLLGLAGLKIVRLTRAQYSHVADMSDAQQLARAALDMALLRIETQSDWRAMMEAGTWSADQPLGNGFYSFEASDPGDGNLTDSDMDPVVIVGTGKSGNARKMLAMQVNFDADGVSSLKSSIHAGLDIDLPSSGLTLIIDEVLSSNATVDANDSLVQGSVEAVVDVTGTSIEGTVTIGIEPREMPDPATAFDFYVANGTSIPVSSLPLVSGDRVIRRTTLAPGYNPFTAETNAEGIYVIDCQNERLRVSNARINGTLVLLNAGSGVIVENSVHWETAVFNYPALLVHGNLELKFDSDVSLSEVLLLVNYNPPGAPYLGLVDLVLTTVYPSYMKGLVYASGELALDDKNPMIEGVLVAGGRITGQNNTTVEVTYNSNFYYNPPPGFRSTPEPTVVPGSFRPVVDN